MRYAAAILLFCLTSKAADEFTLKVTIGDAVKEYNVEKSKTKTEVYAFFQKRMDSIFKFKSQNKNFCMRDHIQLKMSKGENRKEILACARSSQKTTKELIKFSNLVQAEFGKR